MKTIKSIHVKYLAMKKALSELLENVFNYLLVLFAAVLFANRYMFPYYIHPDKFLLVICAIGLLTIIFRRITSYENFERPPLLEEDS